MGLDSFRLDAPLQYFENSNANLFYTTNTTSEEKPFSILKTSTEDLSIPFEIKFLNSSKINFNHKDNSRPFINHCGPLDNGITNSYNGRDVFLSSIIDNAVNHFLVKRLIFDN